MYEIGIIVIVIVIYLIFKPKKKRFFEWETEEQRILFEKMDRPRLEYEAKQKKENRKIWVLVIISWFFLGIFIKGAVELFGDTFFTQIIGLIFFFVLAYAASKILKDWTKGD